MSSTLYNRDILRLAASLIPNDRLEAADGIAEIRSPLCGSRIQAEIALGPDGTIAALALRASACALGQASSAILRGNAIGHESLLLPRTIRTASLILLHSSVSNNLRFPFLF